MMHNFDTFKTQRIFVLHTARHFKKSYRCPDMSAVSLAKEETYGHDISQVVFMLRPVIVFSLLNH